MGHSVDFIIVDDEKEIIPTCYEFAEWHVDREENPYGEYHGHMTIQHDTVFDNYRDALDFLSKFVGDYNDQAVRFMDDSSEIKWLVKVEVHC